ncbi:MAG: transposase [Syntrophales bacterium]
MEKVPKSVFIKEFKEEAVKMVAEGGMSIPEVGRRLSIPKSTLVHWVKRSKEGKLSDPGRKQGHPVTLLGDGSLDKAIPTLDKGKTCLVYCHSDTLSILGARKLIDEGFNKVYRLKGNYRAWVQAGYPVER